MKAETLRSRTAKDLAQLARQRGISGWHSMRKEELVRALLEMGNENGTGARSATGGGQHDKTNRIGAPAERSKSTAPQAPGTTDPSVRNRIEQLHRKHAAHKNLASMPAESQEESPQDDRIVAMVRDPYWLHVFWELSQQSVDRAQAAMGQRWHTAQPTLRIFRLLEAGTCSLERDIAIHGGVSNWYVDVQEPNANYRLEIGYLASDGHYYSLARSSTVQTPPVGTPGAVHGNWSDVAEHADHIFAMSGGYSSQGTSQELRELLEERLQRPLGSPMSTRYGRGASIHSGEEELPLAVEAEIVVHGQTARYAHVTIQGAPVTVRGDGTFSVRLNLPNQRQLIPIVASSGDGVEQRTVVLAVERNTKRMEPVMRDGSQ